MTENHIKQLADQILHHKRKYYDGEPEISDAEYDALEDRLRELNPEHPVLFIVGTPEGGKVQHNPLMLSSDKATGFDDIEKWAQKMEGKTLSAGYKVDGLSLSLEYIDGRLIQAATRGNGEFGDDVTLSVMNIDEIPKHIPVNERINIRGEVFMKISEFDKINNSLADENKFASPRNLAAGTIKQKDVSLLRDRKLNFKAFDMIREGTEQSIQEITSTLMEWEFDVADSTIIDEWTPDNLKETFLHFENERDNIDFEIDGVIFKYNAFKDRINAGQTEHHPKWQIAWKFQSKSDTTKIIKITWQVGRTSILTPVAELEPVIIAGATIKRATLHNADFIQNLNININDVVSIIRSGDVIPKILSVTEKLGDDYEFPRTCPSCKNDTKRNGVNLICTGEKCKERDIQSIIHWIGITEIDGIGPKSVEKLYDSGLIRDYSDLYSNNLSEDKLVSLFGKNGEKMYNSIIKSKELEMHKFLAGLGIPILGKKLGKTLADHFQSLEKIMSANEEDLISLEGISTVSAQSIISGLSENQKIINLLKNGVSIILKDKKKTPSDRKTGLDAFWDNIEVTASETTPHLSNIGKKVYVTGSVESKKKKDVQEFVERLGFTWSTSISKNLEMLIYGSRAGRAKLDKARNLNVKVITWEEFIKEYENSK